MRMRVALFASGHVGLRVTKLIKETDKIALLYLSARDAYADQIRSEANLPDSQVFWARDLKKLGHQAKVLQKTDFDFLVTVYWPYLLEENIFGLAKKSTVNFHPALLPINRGWYPHVHSILDGSTCGVTLHQIDRDADTGPIWSQKKVDLLPTDTAKSIYNRLQEEILHLFTETWPQIKNGQIEPKPQDHSRAVYHEKNEIESLDQIDLDRSYSGRELVNLLRARSFGKYGFAYFEESGEKVYMNLRLSSEKVFCPAEDL